MTGDEADSRERPRWQWSSDLPNFTPARSKARLLAWWLTQLGNRSRKRAPQLAEQRYRRAIGLLEDAFGPKVHALAAPLIGLSDTLVEGGDVAGALPLDERLANILTYSKDGWNAGWAKFRVGDRLMGLQRWDEAVPLLREAKPIYLRSFGSSHPRVAGLLDELAAAEWKSGDYQAALSEFREAVKSKRHPRRLKLDRYKAKPIAATLSQLGFVAGKLAEDLAREGDVEGAEKLFAEARTAAVEGEGPRGWVTGVVLHRFAEFRSDLGQFAVAAALSREAYEILSEHNEPPDRMYLVKIQLFETLRQQAHFIEAVEALREALTLAEAISESELRRSTLAEGLVKKLSLEAELGQYQDGLETAGQALGYTRPDDTSRIRQVLSNEAWCLDGLGRCSEAYGRVLRALATARAPEAPFWFDNAQALTQLAYFGVDHPGLQAEAEKASRAALRITEEARDPNTYWLASAMKELAKVIGEERPLEARSLLERATALLEARYGPAYYETAEWLANLALITVEIDENEVSQAISMLHRADTIIDTSVGRTHPTSAHVVMKEGDVYEVVGRYEDALAAWTKALDIRRSAYGPSHPDLALILDRMETVLRELGRIAEADEVKAQADRLRVRHSPLEPAAVIPE